MRGCRVQLLRGVDGIRHCLPASDSRALVAIWGFCMNDDPRPLCGLGSKRLQSLDALRFIAVAMVLLRHMTPDSAYQNINRITAAGWAGVDLFFVLSGFLIGSLLMAEAKASGAINLRRFYVRRSLKIYPAFIVLLLTYGLVEKGFGENFTWLGLLCELTFTQNYLWHVFNHTWSLAVEEHFYLLIAPLVLALSRGNHLAMLPALAVSVMAACLLARISTYLACGEINMFASHLRMDSLMAGVLLAWIREFRPRSLARLTTRWLLFAAALLTPLLFYGPGGAFYSTIGFTANFVAFSIILVVAINHEAGLRNSRTVRNLALLGSYSYTTYLWHMPVKRGFSMLRQQSILSLDWTSELLVYGMISFMAGYVMASLIERPILALREKLLPAGGRKLAET